MDLNLKNKHPRRIYYLFLVIIFFLASTEIAYSQVKNLSLHLTNVTLEEALAQIKQKGEYSLWYRNEEINLKKKVSLDIKNGSITQILDALFKGEDLGYIIEDKHIVIFKADEKSKAAQQTGKRITGIIKDNTGEPVIGCNIMEKGTSNGTITSVNGDFSLNVAENAVLQISYIGYLTQEIKFKGESLKIILQEDSQTLQEVVVVGYGGGEEVSDEVPVFQVVEEMPEFPGGMGECLKFLGKNIKYPVEAQKAGVQGKVIVQFVVEKDGNIANPKVVRSIDPDLDGEAIRVISIMPKWKPGMQKGQPVRVKYTVPVTFRLDGKDIKSNEARHLELKTDTVFQENPLRIGKETFSLKDWKEKPLLIVDGIEKPYSQMEKMNASDIESISVLKDAAGTAIYGAKAKNGVILITTKKQ